jgi:serine/threonine-protein kinase HipA
LRSLYAFFGSDLVGVFLELANGTISFEYLESEIVTPISLSLPRDLVPKPDAAYAFLDNLLPDDDRVRERWARERGLPAADPFTLLGSYGEDVAGALTLTTDSELPQREPEVVFEATNDDIASRIAALRRESTSWFDPRTHPRMSLAGAQGKFTLAKIGEQWFWPTYETPSTHILKPPAIQHRKIELYEHLALTLAKTVGLVASNSRTAEFLGQPTFEVERWDRADGVRLHAEDLNQALGNRTDGKYDTEKAGAPQIARLLKPFGQEIAFVRQLAFNAAIGNTDAHAKNYSVLLAGNAVRLAPLYDVVPVIFWPKYASTLAMPIGAAKHANDLTARNWQAFAEEATLDPDEVHYEAMSVTRRVADHFESHFAAGGADQARLAMIQKRVRVLNRNYPTPAG